MEIKYAKTDEWVKKDGDVYLVGVSDYAQNELGDLVFVNLPEVGDEVEVGEEFADVESVKAVSGVHSPISGEVVEINEELFDNPELINEDAEGEAWFVKVENVEEFEDGLMTADEYKAYCEGR